MDIKTELKMYLEYCKVSRCRETCEYYKYYKHEKICTPALCMCNYITSNYDIIDINKLEQFNAHDLVLHLNKKCEERGRCIRKITCMECQARLLLADKDLLIRRKE